MVALLLEKGAMASAHNLEGSTALHLAADGGLREIIDLLIDKGCQTRRGGATRAYAVTPLYLFKGHMVPL
jgi:ankyrin repeat protein